MYFYSFTAAKKVILVIMITNLLLAPQIPLIAATVLYPYEMAFNIIEKCVTNRCKIHESSESASLAP